MESYEIYLTKSAVAADLINVGLRNEAEKKKYTSTSFGFVTQDRTMIPAVYHNEGYYYAMAEYESDIPKYELIIC